MSDRAVSGSSPRSGSTRRVIAPIFAVGHRSLDITPSRRAGSGPVAGCVALEAGDHLAGPQCRQAVLVLVKQRVFERHGPLLVGGESIASNGSLWTGCDLMC